MIKAIEWDIPASSHEKMMRRVSAIAEGWEAIKPHVEAAITDRMHALGVPTDPVQKTCFNHFHHNALMIATSFYDWYMDDHTKWVSANGISKARLKKVVDTSKAGLITKFNELRAQVGAHGNLATAHTPDGTPVNRIISYFTDAASPPKEQQDVLHVELDTLTGHMEANLTKLQLEQEFMQAITLAGYEVIMAYLKRYHQFDVDVDVTLAQDIPIPSTSCWNRS